MSDILMFFVEYLKKSYEDNFPDCCNQVYAEEKLDKLIQQRIIFVLEPCFFRGKKYYLLTQKNIREIYKNTTNESITTPSFWREIKQYTNEYNLYGPKQRRLQGYKTNRARGILLTMDFIIDLMNNYMENTLDITFDITDLKWTKKFSEVLNRFIDDNVTDIIDFIQDEHIPFIRYVYDDICFVAFSKLKQEQEFHNQNEVMKHNMLFAELNKIISSDDRYFFQERRRRVIDGKYYRGFDINTVLLCDIIDAIEEEDYIIGENICEANNQLRESNNQSRENNPAYRMFKRSILERDNHKCQCCGLNKRLHVHHIYSYTTHPELATDVTNGIVLCQFCHQKYHSVYGKKDSVNPVTFAQFIKRFGIR